MEWLRHFRGKEEFRNREGLVEYDFTLHRSRHKQGVSAMVRVRNEHEKIYYCLKSILSMFDEIILIDNGSEDATAHLVQQLKEREDTEGRLKLLHYPHRLARFGPDHGATPEDSVHSAVYYTNWSVSRCSYRYVCKWDGDMVLVPQARGAFKQFLSEIQSGRPKCWVLAGQTIYRDLEGDFYLARGEVNKEVEIFPYGFNCRFIKHENWERLRRPWLMKKGEFEPVCFFELKFVDEDEFSHWSTRDWPTRRKQREWDNYWRVRNGDVNAELFEKLPRAFLDAAVGQSSGI